MLLGKKCEFLINKVIYNFIILVLGDRMDFVI